MSSDVSSPPGRAIIISTGRCGSTLLSDLIVDEPETLSVQEFFIGLSAAARTGDTIDGAAYWAMLSSPRPDLATLFRIGRPPKELHYPPDGKWAGKLVEIPRILAITIPKITDDPDGLFDILTERVSGFPSQPIGQHHRMFLDLLATLTGRRRWVERSGGSCWAASYLLRTFTDAKIVYLTRNWADTAQSMSRHPLFQMLQLRAECVGQYGVDPFNLEPGQTMPPEAERFLPDRLTAEALQERGQDVRRYLGLCAFMTSKTEQSLIETPPSQLLTMRYEDLVDQPVAQLSRLGEFLEFADPQGWAERTASRVKAPARAMA